MKLTIRAECGRILPTNEAIFLVMPTIGSDSFRLLIRFLVGMGDFARVNSHNPRWASLPGLRESTSQRKCLFCWAANKKRFLDSEWHMLLTIRL